jgi:hypothetical protein
MKFDQTVKQIFIDFYNNPKVPSGKLHKALTTKLQEGGYLAPNVEFDAETVREAYEDKLQMEYRNRPRKVKEKIVIEFETEEQQVSVEVTIPVEDEEDDTAWDSTPITRAANNY